MRELKVATLVPIIQEHYLNFSLNKVKKVHRIDNSMKVEWPVEKQEEGLVDVSTFEVHSPDLIIHGRYVFFYNEEFQILVIGYADELDE